MISTTTITITRPSMHNHPFFYDSVYYTNNRANFQPYYNNSVNAGDILSYSDKISENGLTLTRVLTFVDAQAKQNYCDTFYSAFPEYLATRQNYCNTMTHTLTVIET